MVIIATVTTAFIFSNSLKPSSASWESSNAVALLLQPILRKCYELASALVAWSGHTMTFTYWAFVRKMAHFAEYFVLGAECAGIGAYLAGRAISPHLLSCLFVPLLVAVVDEYMQGFVGRTSVVSDVLLDFSGALAGSVIVTLIAALVFSRARKRHLKG